MEKKVSVIIPNYNGKGLLAKNLPQVLKHCPHCEIIIVDDASTDGSVAFVTNNYKNIKVIKLNKNRGFAAAINEGVKYASGKFVLLLNSDIVPRNNFLIPALKHFENQKEQDIFAVALKDYSHEVQKVIVRGRGGALFRQGFLTHFAKENIAGDTFWVSGGSGLFDKKKFQNLGGFDTNFAPFYWEDIDLSFRAWLSGYKCIFEPQASVDHFHEEGAIKKSKSAFFIKTVSYKNQFLFVWKNIENPLLILEHLTWFPYHVLRSIFLFDWTFIVGFVWAALKIPSLILNSQSQTANYKHGDKEVLKKFERS